MPKYRIVKIEDKYYPQERFLWIWWYLYTQLSVAIDVKISRASYEEAEELIKKWQNYKKPERKIVKKIK